VADKEADQRFKRSCGIGSIDRKIRLKGRPPRKIGPIFPDGFGEVWAVYLLKEFAERRVNDLIEQIKFLRPHLMPPFSHSESGDSGFS